MKNTMKFRKITSLLIVCIIIIVIIINSNLSVSAHEYDLHNVYDECVVTNGSGNKWYKLRNTHITEETPIRYVFCEGKVINSPYFNQTEDHTSHVWPGQQAEINSLFTSFSNSMELWNDIYVSKFNLNQNGVTINGIDSFKKLVDVAPGTWSNYNVIVCPTEQYNNNDIAYAQWDGNYYQVETGNTNHYHHSGGTILINLPNAYNYSTEKYRVGTRVGAHELGHILGLGDMYNEYCNGTTHTHYNTIMGDSMNIEYEDIIGVAINQGLHTAADHVMVQDSINGSQYKVRCILCNAVFNTTSTIYNRSYVKNACGNNHLYNMGNVIQAGFSGKYHFYKCKHCGQVTRSPHQMSSATNNPTKYNHVYSCTICDYKKEEAHNFTLSSYTSSQHCLACQSCNYNKSESHNYYATSYTALRHYLKCEDCPSTTSETHDMYNYMGINRCRKCPYAQLKPVM